MEAGAGPSLAGAPGASGPKAHPASSASCRRWVGAPRRPPPPAQADTSTNALATPPSQQRVRSWRRRSWDRAGRAQSCATVREQLTPLVPRLARMKSDSRVARDRLPRAGFAAATPACFETGLLLRWTRRATRSANWPASPAVQPPRRSAAHRANWSGAATYSGAIAAATLARSCSIEGAPAGNVPWAAPRLPPPLPPAARRN